MDPPLANITNMLLDMDFSFDNDIDWEKMAAFPDMAPTIPNVTNLSKNFGVYGSFTELLQGSLLQLDRFASPTAISSPTAVSTASILACLVLPPANTNILNLSPNANIPDLLPLTPFTPPALIAHMIMEVAKIDIAHIAPPVTDLDTPASSDTNNIDAVASAATTIVTPLIPAPIVSVDATVPAKSGVNSTSSTDGTDSLLNTLNRSSSTTGISSAPTAKRPAKRSWDMVDEALIVEGKCD
ncbi:hypothetical protein BDN71DRAFT_1431652 [Pleurotus eryngii]|uniref:Uncharacterized protein n=1 Tax=Pleurotus eryngii TaxID=5323 RepID=A0A9P6DG40_PLEER|nr:hypothetical protein BDN71DRAFT_1431652 [Pleurotus eryngii]